jgi:hypothetical protein
MGDLQDPIDGGMLVPYFWPYELWGYSLKFTICLCQNRYGKSPFIVDFPMKNGDFPAVTLVYQRVGIMYGRYLQYIGS